MSARMARKFATSRRDVSMLPDHANMSTISVISNSQKSEVDFAYDNYLEKLMMKQIALKTFKYQEDLMDAQISYQREAIESVKEKIRQENEKLEDLQQQCEINEIAIEIDKSLIDLSTFNLSLLDDLAVLINAACKEMQINVQPTTNDECRALVKNLDFSSEVYRELCSNISDEKFQLVINASDGYKKIAELHERIKNCSIENAVLLNKTCLKFLDEISLFFDKNFMRNIIRN